MPSQRSRAVRVGAAHDERECRSAGVLRYVLASEKTPSVTSWHLEFFESLSDEAAGTAVGEGAFSPGPALWLGKREVAHFDDEHTLDVRLTKSEIRRRRNELSAHDGIRMRGPGSDWVEIRVETDEDIARATEMVRRRRGEPSHRPEPSAAYRRGVEQTQTRPLVVSR